MLACLAAVAIAAQHIDPGLYDCMKWRMIGPYRGGRTVGADGIADKPNTFYIGVNNGGVWRTTDAGRTWTPIFDDQPTGSIGALGVAPSNPNVIYVGSGEGLQRPDLSVGDGMYKTTDGGKTWVNTGLRDGLQISAVAVDPKNENRAFAAVLGHPYGPNEQRGVYRTLNGGKSWEQVLGKGIDTGAVQVVIDPSNANTIYADMWSARQGPWENGQWQGPNSGLYKSTDGGDHWSLLSEGLPTFAQGLGRIGMAVAASNPKRLYATVDADAQHGGIYLSDDAGASWSKINGEGRLWGRGSDFAEIKVDPTNAERVYVANTSTYRSEDGGKSFICIKGAPGGDDYHTIWINPKHPDVILLASDQGATISVNDGDTWSSWYNQPTAQFYHVSTDKQFPYWVYGGQQESGSAGVVSRGNDGQITFREWHPVGVEEYGYVAPDPLNPNYIFGGKITRFDKATGQVLDVSPEAIRTGKYRFLRTAPVIFSTVDPHALYFAGNVLFRTRTGGYSWDVISPDLTREHPEVPESIGVFATESLKTMPRRGVIYTVAPSYVDAKLIWCGTDDGLIHVTRDGGKGWTNVTPPELTSWSKVSMIDSGRFDRNTAYAAVNRIRLDDLKPHIYRTHDGGKSWTQIVAGLPDNAPVNTVREDPKQRGLLYCGTETSVWFSSDDGDHWQPLRLNMPATSIRDLVIHEDDVVVGTHGRSFWILDDITPLRQLPAASAANAFLYQPQTAYRVRWNNWTDTPLPKEEPAGQNPPDGAVIDYYLKSNHSTVALEILDGAGKLVRSYSSTNPGSPIPPSNITVEPEWQRPPQALSVLAGSHRFTWDCHYPPLPGSGRFLPISAIWRDTDPEPHGPWAMPGEYKVRLRVDSEIFERPLTLKMDPRVKASGSDLRKQFEVAHGSYELVIQIREALRRIARQKAFGHAALKAEVQVIENGTKQVPGLAKLADQLQGLMSTASDTDVVPTSQVLAGYGLARTAAVARLGELEKLK